MTSTGAVSPPSAGAPGPLRSARWVRSSSQLSQSGVSAMAEGGGHVEPVGQLPDQAVEVGGPRLGHGDGRAHGGPRAGHGDGDQDGHQQDDDRDGENRPPHGVPGRSGQVPLRVRGEQHDGDGRGQDRHAQRPAADTQQGERPGPRGPRAQLLTHIDTGHGRMSPPLPRDGVVHSPTVAPVTDIAMPVGQVPERLRRTLVGAPAGVIRMAQPSPDGMALGKAADVSAPMGVVRFQGVPVRGGSGTRAFRYEHVPVRVSPSRPPRTPVTYGRAGGGAAGRAGGQDRAASRAMSVRCWEPSRRMRPSAV